MDDLLPLRLRAVAVDGLDLVGGVLGEIQRELLRSDLRGWGRARGRDEG